MDFLKKQFKVGRKKLKKRVAVVNGKRIASHGVTVHAEENIPPAKVMGFNPSDADLPARVDLRKYCSPIEDQSQSNSCCANAAVGAYEYLCCRDAAQNGDTPGDISRLFVYYVGRMRDKQLWNDSTPISDEGLTLTGAVDALSMKGACLAESWPFELDSINKKPPAESFVEAMQFKVSSAKKIPADVGSMRACLAEGYPIIFGLKLTQKFFNPGSRGVIKTPDPDDPKSAEHGLHAMLMVGYSDKQERFIVRNSWGENWADNGYCYIPYSYAANEEFNFLGQYAICGLTETDFTPDQCDDDEDLFDEGDDDDAGGDYKQEEDDVDEGDDEEVDEDMFDATAEARRVFDQFDKDGSGELSVKELKKALKYNGTFMKKRRLKKLMEKYDEDGSGSLSFDEFVAFPGVLSFDNDD